MSMHREGTAGAASAADQVSSTKQQAVDTAQAGKAAATDVAATASGAAKDVAQKTGEQARDLVGKTRGEVREQVGTQQSAIVGNLRSLGDQLAEMTEHVEHQGTAVDLAAGARDRVRTAADWLDGREPGDVLDELRSLGRNKPGAFLLGAVVAGVVTGRMTRGVVAEHTGGSSEPDTSDTTARPAHRASEPTTDTAPRIAPSPGGGLIR